MLGLARHSPQDLLDHLGRTRFDNADNEPPSFGAAGDELPTISHFNRGIVAFSRNGRCPSIAEPSWLARGCVHTVGNCGGAVVLDAQTFSLTDTGHALAHFGAGRSAQRMISLRRRFSSQYTAAFARGRICVGVGPPRARARSEGRSNLGVQI